MRLNVIISLQRNGSIEFYEHFTPWVTSPVDSKYECPDASKELNIICERSVRPPKPENVQVQA